MPAAAHCRRPLLSCARSRTEGARALAASVRRVDVLTLAELVASGRATCTVEEAAEVVGVGRGTAYDAARSGELPALHLGRRIVVPVASLVKLLGATAPKSPELT